MKNVNLPLLLTLCFSLTLGGVGVSAPRVSAQAASTQAASTQAASTQGDGDGDELTEHWTEPKYAAEARRQMAGTAGAFALAGALAAYRRRKRHEAV